jgi:hypothetical protein
MPPETRTIRFSHRINTLQHNIYISPDDICADVHQGTRIPPVARFSFDPAALAAGVVGTVNPGLTSHEAHRIQ